MLVRTFRLTDKLSNALLRLVIWLGEVLTVQAYRLRVGLVRSAETFFFTLTQTIRTGRIAYESNEEKRRAMMARRAAEAAMRPSIQEDPLKIQNRALSMFTVVLMALLMMLVLWFTSSGQQSPNGLPQVAGGPLPLQTITPTGLPTILPTATATPNPFLAGSIVFSLREQGHEHLWAAGIGQGSPIRLTNVASDDTDPAWSPDGARVAFSSHRDGNWELYVLDVGTGNTNRLTYDLAYEGAPTWSPDGKYIAYEGYDENQLNLFIIASDGSEKPIQVTRSGAPNYAPSWSPDGSRIAYVSLRDGNQEIYIAELRPTLNEAALRFTRTADVDEDNPTWSPDGQTLAYNARVNGYDLVYVKPVAQPDAEPQVVGQGRQPAWAPNGGSVVFAVDSGADTNLIGGQAATNGVTTLAVSVHGRAAHPSWSASALPASLVQSGRAPQPTIAPLYSEQVHFQQPNPPYFRLAQLNGVDAPYPYLSDKVDDSFTALRQAVVQQIGFDFLGTLKDATWGIEKGNEHIPEPGQSLQSWHFAGRAFDFDRNLVYGTQPPLELVREDIVDAKGLSTYWRVYIRVPDGVQGGQLGKPMKHLSWDFASRTSSDPQVYANGGQLKAAVPTGYYVDFTQIAEDYGWTRIPSDRTWRSNFSGLLYWEYDKQEHMAWNDAMLQLYPQDQINAFLSGAASAPASQPTETPGPTRTPTPIPPDKK